MLYNETRIYQRSLELVELAHMIGKHFPRGNAYLNDQLKRAVTTITLNFAEGYGKNSRKEERRFFSMAKASANEVAAIMDIALRLEMISERNALKALELCDHLARMLSQFRRE